MQCGHNIDTMLKQHWGSVEAMLMQHKDEFWWKHQNNAEVGGNVSGSSETNNWCNVNTILRQW